MIVGSFASNYWGRPRNTHDADLVVEILPTKATGLAKLLEAEFYSQQTCLVQNLICA